MTGSQERPNVVLVHSHDTGRHLGCYDRGVSTPNIDAIADAGIRFDNTFCTAPQCSPSRASMMTGQYPHEVGMFGLAHLGWSLGDDVETLPQVLAEAGYQSVLFNFQHIADWGDAKTTGFEAVYDEEHHATDVARRFERELPSLQESGPFFASIGFTEPHLPLRRDYVDEKYYEYYHPDSVEPFPFLPDCRGVREDVAEYNGLITGMLDRGVGIVHDAIEEAGIAENTLFIYTTDHGVPFPRAKGSCYDPGLEIALIMSHPGTIPTGETEDALLSNVDLMPTILEYVGVEGPSMSGRSFRPLLDGEGQYQPRDVVFAELTYHGQYHPTRAIRTEKTKFIRNFDHGPSVYIPGDVYTTRSGRVVREEMMGGNNRPEEECYDLERDAGETDSVAGGDRIIDDPEPADSEYSALVDEFRNRLHRWMAETDDPLLDGPIDLPKDTQRAPFNGL